MHVKTMEGLIGARTNMNLTRIPMRVYKEAKNRGDTQGMERAMQYAGEFTERAKDYQERADEGMKEEAEEIKAKRSQESRKAAEKHREGKEKPENGFEEIRKEKTDTVEISQRGKGLAEEMKREGGTVQTEDTADVINSGMR